MPLLCLFLLLFSCQSPAEEQDVLAVSIQPQRYLLEQLVGDRFDVVCLLQEGANPESYEPSIGAMTALERSRAYFMVGHIGFETALLNKIAANQPDLRLCDTSEGIMLDQGNTGDHGEAGDPHVWTSVVNAKVMARNMLEGLLQLDPAHRNEYINRHRALQHRLDSLDAAFATRLKDMAGSTFIVWHPSLTYFARDYHLKQLAIEQEGKEATPAQLRDAVAESRRSGAQVFFYQREFDSRVLESLNRDIGARVVEISPMSYDWERQMTAIVDALTASPSRQDTHEQP